MAQSPRRSGTFSKCYPVTPSDTVDLPQGPAGGGVMTLTAGNLVVINGPSTITFTAVPAFFRVPFIVTRVLATGTTASVVALYS